MMSQLNVTKADKPVTPMQLDANTAYPDQFDWENDEDTEKYSKTLNFSELKTNVIYKVTPVKVVVRKFGPQLLMEVEPYDANGNIRPESFPVFAPNNYRDRVKNLCGSMMAAHLLKYNGMASKNGRKMHDYKLAKLPEVKPQEQELEAC